MSEDIQKDLVSYRQLQELEDDFEDVEVELLRHQTKLTSDLYAKRAKVIASIPGFWPLVMEQAPADIDDYISPSDAALLNSALVDLTVERFELPAGGDPRSIAIRMTFADNDHLAAQTLEKRFWWRHARDGWSGLVSEPVAIAWKSPDKDLTGGLLDLACRLRQAEIAAGAAAAGDAAVAEAKKALLAQMEDAGGEGGVSFFAFFGFCGRRVSVEESVEAKKVEDAKRAEVKAGKHVEDEEDDDDDDDDDDDGLDEYETEIFPTADDVAVSIAEDLYPNAIKYFISAQEQDALSDMDFEELDDEDDEEMVEVNGDDESSKKRKA